MKGSKVLIMSLTYKENVADTRESPVREIVKELKEFGVAVYGYDPLLSNKEIEGFCVKALVKLNKKMDCVIVAVAHDEFKNKPFLKTFLKSFIKKASQKEKLYQKKELRFSFSTGFLLKLSEIKDIQMKVDAITHNLYR